MLRIFKNVFIKSVVLITLIFLTNGYAKEKNAGLAMLFCIFPGGGQFYTERYIPGVIIGTTESILGYYAYKYHREGNHEKRNSLLWWGFFVFGYSLADAYVGAKMYGFDVDADIDKVSVSYKIKW